VSIIEISLFFLLLSVLIFVLAEYFVWSPGHDDTLYEFDDTLI